MDDDFTYVFSWQGMVYVAIRRENSTPRCFPILLIHRRLRPQNRRLARLDLDDDRLRLGCSEPGSRLIDCQSRNRTVAARVTAERNPL
ncbi:hypothetical protein KY389_15060, partial [Paracoccus bogoriensis]|nr:hypothetical protein [Paracoccus bogoriensis]